MNFGFEFFNIQMNEKSIIYHDCDGFKWQNINIYSNFDYFSLWSNALFGLFECDYTLSYIFVF
jgi:hypothetical protein